MSGAIVESGEMQRGFRPGRMRRGAFSARRNNCLLVVEDHEDTARALMRWLKSLGLRSVQARNSTEALQILEDVVYLEARFAGVLVDYRLPDGLGSRIAQSFLDEGPGTPVAMMTAYRDQALSIWSEAHGVPIFEKPLQVSRLEDWLAGSLETGMES